jgi:hypothetical protein
VTIEQVTGVMVWRRNVGEPALHGDVPMHVKGAPPLKHGKGRVYTKALNVYGMDAEEAAAIAVVLDAHFRDPKKFALPEVEV